MTVYGMRCLEINNETLKIVGTYFLYNEKLKEGKNVIRLSQIFNKS